MHSSMRGWRSSQRLPLAGSGWFCVDDDTESGLISKIQAEVVAAHTRLDSLSREISSRFGSLDNKQSELAQDIKRLLAREPSKTPLFVQLAVLGFMLTILSLVTVPIATRTWATAEDLKKHDDGHPHWVTKIMDERIDKLLMIMTMTDKKHADEHLEQEEDIENLRAEDARTEQRVDRLSEEVVRLSTIAEERTERFKRVIQEVEKRLASRASDRWTGTNQEIFKEGLDFRMKAHEQIGHQHGRGSGRFGPPDRDD